MVDSLAKVCLGCTDMKRIGCAVVLALAMSTGESLPIAASSVSIAATGATETSAPTPLQLAQAQVQQLTERSDYVGACRKTTATALTIYEDSRLTKSVGTVQSNTVVTLTGVLGNGTAQIRVPSLGWIQSATLSTDCSSVEPPASTLPADIDTNPKYCRRVRDSKTDGANYKDLDRGLIADDNPGKGVQTYLGTPDGPGGAAVVRLTRDPAESQDVGSLRWIRIRYTSRSGEKRVGWVSNGSLASNKSNLASCLPGQT